MRVSRCNKTILLFLDRGWFFRTLALQINVHISYISYNNNINNCHGEHAHHPCLSAVLLDKQDAKKIINNNPKDSWAS